MNESRIPPLDLSGEVDVLWDELTAAMERVLRSQKFIMGPEVGEFERDVARYLGVKHALGVNSGTDALVISLRALDIGPGDEVITTPFSFFATAESISMVGAVPIFVDVEENGFNIDPSKIEAAITAKTRAIMPVHLFGRPANMAAICSLAEDRGLWVIEDCAQSFGACIEERKTGAIGVVGAFSFFPTKNLGAYGDGGLIATNVDSIADQVRMLRAHGAKKKYHNEILGYNSRLDTVQAAILRVKLPHVDAWNISRVHAATIYEQLLGNVPGIVTPEISPGHVFHQYTIRVVDQDRNEVQRRLASQGIDSMVYYPIPQDRLPIYDGRYPRNDISDLLSQQVLSLPIWPGIAPEIQGRVAFAVKS